tara:strand:+ start:4290 stop:5090 length:801 start_codon:yes stop_codon:yes gene_type:complete
MMGPRVVIKLGGGLITEKASMRTFDAVSMESVSIAISELSALGASIVLVHGAGSFGHILAKEWSIADGLVPEISSNQRDAVRQIRSDMKELNAFVVSSLAEMGLECESYPPSEWVTGTGRDFDGNLEKFNRMADQPIPITFGDVVKMEDDSEFGILSGDDLMLRLSKEIPEVTHSIFLMTDADGIMDRPPNERGSRLLPTWSPRADFKSEHKSQIDVTGGIRLKIERAAEISESVEQVWILDGREPSRIIELVQTGKTLGTKILPG